MKYLILSLIAVCAVGCHSDGEGAVSPPNSGPAAANQPMANNPNVPPETKKAMSNAFSTRGTPPPAPGGN